MLQVKSQAEPEYEAPGNFPKQDLLGTLCFTSLFPQKPSKRLLQIRSHENFALTPLVLIAPRSYLYTEPGYLLGKCLPKTCASGSSPLPANTHLLWLRSEHKESCWGRECIPLCFQTTYSKTELILPG